MVKMKSKYVPEFVPGQIIVCFRSKFNNGDFASSFGKGLGYEFLGNYVSNDMYAYKVPEGSELKVLKRFRQYSEFVDWASRLDKKFEDRANDRDTLENMVLDLDDHIEASDEEYNIHLDKIIKYAKSLKYVIGKTAKTDDKKSS
jgi:hypothetical protein